MRVGIWLGILETWSFGSHKKAQAVQKHWSFTNISLVFSALISVPWHLRLMPGLGYLNWQPIRPEGLDPARERTLRVRRVRVTASEWSHAGGVQLGACPAAWVSLQAYWGLASGYSRCSRPSLSQLRLAGGPGPGSYTYISIECSADAFHCNLFQGVKLLSFKVVLCYHGKRSTGRGRHQQNIQLWRSHPILRLRLPIQVDCLVSVIIMVAYVSSPPPLAGKGRAGALVDRCGIGRLCWVPLAEDWVPKPSQFEL